MRSKNNLTTIIIILMITTTAAIGWYFSRPQSQALATSNNAVQAPAVEQQKTDVRTTINTESIFPITQKANGLTAQVTSARQIENGIEVVVCYPTPDAGEWYPTPGHLYYSTWEILPDEFESVSEQKADGVNVGQNCEAIRYRIDEKESITVPIKFVLLGYRAIPREGSACKDLQTRLDSSPKAKTYGLNVNCTEDEQGTRTATLSGHASSVSQAEAQAALDEILGANVSGPWEFSISALGK